MSDPVSAPELAGYTDLEPIGRGGATVVYRARQSAMGGRDVAVKVMNAAHLGDDVRLRFERECAAAGRLSWHPNVVSCYDAGFTDADEPYLVMEYLPAGSLGDRIRRGDGLPFDRVVTVGIEIADALQSAHAVGLVHRDVKPANILVGVRGRPMLTDFGVAIIDGSARSRSGTFNATITHAPPEVLAGQRADHRADIYALGSTLFTLAAGNPPFDDPDDTSLLGLVERITEDPVPDLTAYGLPADVDAVIRRAMEKDPAERWPSVGELGEALAATLRSG